MLGIGVMITLLTGIFGVSRKHRSMVRAQSELDMVRWVREDWEPPKIELATFRKKGKIAKDLDPIEAGMFIGVPYKQIFSTILSQSTSDINRDRGFYALKERFADWSELLDAPVDDIVATIRPAGLANQKGPRIQEALRFIQEQRGELTLNFLDALSLDEARAWLIQIKGVGLKTASIVLLFSFGRLIH